jgi:hypothetical protein
MTRTTTMHVQVETKVVITEFAAGQYDFTAQVAECDWDWGRSNSRGHSLVVGDGTCCGLVQIAVQLRAACAALREGEALWVTPSDSDRASAYRRVERYGFLPYTEIEINEGRVTFARPAWVFYAK